MNDAHDLIADSTAVIILNALATVCAPSAVSLETRRLRENTFAALLRRDTSTEVPAVITALLYALPDNDGYIETAGCGWWPGDHLSLQLTGWPDHLATFLRPARPKPDEHACLFEWQPASILEDLALAMQRLPEEQRGFEMLNLLSAVVHRLWAYGVPMHHVLDIAVRTFERTHDNDDHLAALGKAHRPHRAWAQFVDSGRFPSDSPQEDIVDIDPDDIPF